MALQEISPLEMQRADRARLAPLLGERNGRDQNDKREVDVGDEDKAEYLPVRTLRTQYIDYLTTKVDEIEEQKDSRHYYHGAHWTPEQIRVLRARRQPPQTWNRIGRKINGIVGIVERMRSDPKALANSPKSEPGAEIATQVVRYVLGTNQFKTLDPWCLLQSAIDGIAGVQKTLIEGDEGDPDIGLSWVIGDEYFYDPKSYKPDFSDARYEGIAKWLDVDAAVELFPDKEEMLRSLVEGDSDLTTNADREYKWVITATHRLRLCEHWYKHSGRWCWAFYVSTTLIDQGVSPFFDGKGKSARAFNMFSAAVDHDGDRYGFVRNMKGPQDALNQGKSKTLHIANSRRLIMEKGAVDDVETARREWARPDGVVEVNPGKQVKPDETTTDLAAFSQFTEDAKSELDQYGNTNLAVLNGSALGNISGRALEILRQPGLAELTPFILAYRTWKVQLYRDIWWTAQRHWKAQRWLRVTDNDGLKQFIQLNGLSLDQNGRPAIVNAVGALDVDIDLDEGPDIVSVMEDAFDYMTKCPPGTFPPQMLIEMNPRIPRSEKNRLLQMMQPKPQKPNPMAEMNARLELEGKAARNAKTAAETHKTHASAEQAYATAAEKRAKVGTEAARAGHIATEAHLGAAEFARDTLLEAHQVERELSQPMQPQPRQPQPVQGA